MQEATLALSQSTKTLTVAVIDNGEVWHSGYANILLSPEFYNIDVTAQVLALLEEGKRIRDLLMLGEWDEPVEIMFGEDTGWQNFEPVGIIACRFTTPQTKGALAVIGSTRLNYPVIIPVVRYFSSLLSEAYN
ncbi:MAG: Heat-inducible transcription repressor HrcA, partial [Candidatus Daviesbacteria bacterium GW2011_GWB1_36_5]